MASVRKRSLLVGPACGYDRAVSDAPCDVASFQGDWLSWLERAVHIREVTGSNPVSPTTPFLLCVIGFYGRFLLAGAPELIWPDPRTERLRVSS